MPLTPDVLTRASDPVLQVRLSPEGRLRGASARARIERPAAEVWELLQDLEGYVRYLPMVDRVERSGDELTLSLRFKLGLFSAGLRFTAHATYSEGRTVELRWVAGEPRDLRLRFELTDAGDGACIVDGEGEFDLQSLGWVVKYFLKHHPEIELGIYPGVALALIDALRRAAAAR